MHANQCWASAKRADNKLLSGQRHSILQWTHAAHAELACGLTGGLLHHCQQALFLDG